MPLLFDSHCHLSDTPLSDLPSFSHNCYWIMSQSPDQWDKVQCLSVSNDRYYSALGVHPWFIDQMVRDKGADFYYQWWTKQAVELEKRLSFSNITGIGEVGLDAYGSMHDTLEAQLLTLHDQLDIAHQHKKPVSIHCRKAFTPLLQVIKKRNLSGIMHGFSGSVEQARQFIRCGFRIGVGPTLLSSRAVRYHRLVAELDIEYLVIESDYPYNRQVETGLDSSVEVQSSHLETILEQLVWKIAQLQSLPINEVVTKLYKNAENTILNR
jgi:TatD DNase family protein